MLQIKFIPEESGSAVVCVEDALKRDKIHKSMRGKHIQQPSAYVIRELIKCNINFSNTSRTH